MIPLLGDLKHVQSTPPVALNANSNATCAAIDTLGYEYLRVMVDFGAVQAGVSQLNLQESDAANMASAAAITGTNVGTDNNDTGSASTLPAENTANNTSVAFFVNLKGHKRYIQPVLEIGSGSNGTVVSITVELDRAHEEPRTAALANIGQRMVV